MVKSLLDLFAICYFQFFLSRYTYFPDNPIAKREVMNISGRVALVTGANRGIGHALVEALIARGAKKIYATARDISTLTHFTSSHLDMVRSVRLDITDHAAVANAAATCNDVELVINNAGISHVSGLISAISLEDSREEMEVNYFGTLAMCRSFSNILRSNGGGCIVNVLSILSHVTMPTLGSYCASKAAALRLTEGVRAELAEQNTTVISVMPGAVDTEMTKDFDVPKMTSQEVSESVMDAVEAGTEDVYPGDGASELRMKLDQNAKEVEKELAGSLPK